MAIGIHRPGGSGMPRADMVWRCRLKRVETSVEGQSVKISHIDTVIFHVDTDIFHIDTVIFHIDTDIIRSSSISILSSCHLVDRMIRSYLITLLKAPGFSA